MKSKAIWVLLLAGPACNGDKDDSAGDGDADTDTDTDSDTDTDTDTDTDCSGKPAGVAEKSIVGSYTVVPGKSYAGTEAVEYTTKEGKGDLLCRITYTLTSTAVRTDCAEGKDDYAFDCTGLWAFDLVSSGAAIDPKYPDCAGILCGTEVATLNDQAVSYAYGVVVGHAWMIGEYNGKAWQPRAYPDGKPESAATYEFVRAEDATVDYYE